jgi:hypothetical protein
LALAFDRIDSRDWAVSSSQEFTRVATRIADHTDLVIGNDSHSRTRWWADVRSGLATKSS